MKQFDLILFSFSSLSSLNDYHTPYADWTLSDFDEIRTGIQYQGLFVLGTVE
jgi:hypothetical protein